MQDVLLDKKEELEKLNKSYDRMQKKYGAKELDSIYNGGKIDKIPGYEIEYHGPNGEDDIITPESFDPEKQVVSYIIIKIKPNDDKSFILRPGTSVKLMTKYRVKTFAGSSAEANNLNDLKFNGGTTFSWKVPLNGENQTYTKGEDKDTPYVYITPYKARTTVGIGQNDNYNTGRNITLDASKNENYTALIGLDLLESRNDSEFTSNIKV